MGATSLDGEMVRRFFDFMAKREALRLKKETGAPWPWSDDSILNTYKFTNVKREDDRTTRWMRENWTRPNEDRPAGEILFNCALFRYFGTSEFAAAIGWQTTWDPAAISRIAADRSRLGQRVFTGAYIIPTLGKRRPKADVVCFDILTPLWRIKEEIGEVALATRSWRRTAERLMTLPGFGGTGFMAKEALQDVMQTTVLRSALDRNQWCPAGPGARRGLNRITCRPLNFRISEQTALEEMQSLYQSAPAWLPDYMPALELHDVQFQLCEFDKYERVARGEGTPKARYRLLTGS